MFVEWVDMGATPVNTERAPGHSAVNALGTSTDPAHTWAHAAVVSAWKQLHQPEHQVAARVEEQVDYGRGFSVQFDPREELSK